MNKSIVTTIGAILLGITLFIGGTFFGQSRWSMMNDVNNSGTMMNNEYMPNNMMTGENMPNNMMDGNMANGMMSGQMNSNMMSGQMGSMMQGNNMMSGQMEMMDGNMMGMMAILDNDYEGEPISLADAETAVQAYIATLKNDNLTLGEVMIFSNHAYAQILDKSNDMGIYEVLVDPETLQVYPEPGPNMMWNANYEHGNGMMMGQNGMMSQVTPENGEMLVDEKTAVTLAQQYLDTYMSGMVADETADVFSGYYTIHILKDGEVTGMLSVNGYTQQVMVHTWHGDFVEMTDDYHN